MPSEPVIVTLDSPFKLMVRDLQQLSGNESQAHPWKIQFPGNNSGTRPVVIEFSQIWLQGSVKSCTNNAESIVLTDSSGDVRVTRCSRVPGDRSWIKTGAYCGVFACVKTLSTSDSEVEAIKVMDLVDVRNEAESMWSEEVQELAYYLRDRISFN